MSFKLRVAHLSDLHFWKKSYNPLQFCCKRWLGNLNSWLVRHNELETGRLEALPELFSQLGVNLVLIAGDLTTTGRMVEFRMARELIQQMKEHGIEVALVPGNHDHYTHLAYWQGRIYRYFPEETSDALKRRRVASRQLQPGLWLVTMDTALATSWISSEGSFSEAIERELERTLLQIPSSDRAILLNHFPLFCLDHRFKKLRRDSELRLLLQRFPQVQLYLHGHTHRHSIADLRPDNLPIVIDSGCVSLCKWGRWNLIDLSETGCIISPHAWQEDLWSSVETVEYSWR